MAALRKVDPEQIVPEPVRLSVLPLPGGDFILVFEDFDGWIEDCGDLDLEALKESCGAKAVFVAGFPIEVR